MTEIERAQTGAVARGIEGATVTDVSLRFDADITVDRAEQIAGVLGRIDRSAKWWLGSWVEQYAELRGGGVAGEAAALQVGSELTGYSETALANWKEVQTRIPEAERDSRLDFTTYIELSKILRAGMPMSVLTETRDRLIELRETWDRRNGTPYPNHKVAREIIAGVLDSGGADARLFDFPTSDEQIAEQSAEIVRLRTELEDVMLATGRAVRCPMCHEVHPIEAARAAVAPRE